MVSEMSGKGSKTVKEKATGEQLRLARYLSDKEDPRLNEKVKQVIEVTGKCEDEVYLALHDCNNDALTAINMLIEGKNDMWLTKDKKKRVKKPKTPVQEEPKPEPKCEISVTPNKTRAPRVFYNSSLKTQPEPKNVQVTTKPYTATTFDWANHIARLRGNHEDWDQDYNEAVLETHIFTPTAKPDSERD